MDLAGQHQTRNQLLASLSEQDYERIAPFLKPVRLQHRKRLQLADRPITEAYFPESGIASVVAIGGGDRRQAEVGIIGREGMVGLPIVLGTGRSPCEVMVQVDVEGFAISAEDLSDLVAMSAGIRAACLRYVHAFSIQSAHTALANAKGKLEERLARWLIMSQDRLGGHRLDTTHEFLSLMLGVRRAGVTMALRQFEKNELTASERGAITIRDRAALEKVANGLYGVPEAEYRRLFPTVSPTFDSAVS